jgi:3-oxoadipate enol-lactonase
LYLEKENNIKIYYETYGDKKDEPLLLIHGLGLDHNMYKKQIDKYQEHGFYLITPDMRAHGKSSKVESLKISDWAEDIRDLMDELNLKTANLLGVSMGGIIAQKFAVEYPTRVNKLILSDTFPEIVTLAEKAVSIGQVLALKLFNILPNKVGASFYAAAYKDYAEEVANYFKEVTLRADFNQLVIARLAINEVGLLDELVKIDSPTLIMAGDKILIGPAEKMKSKIEPAELQIIEGSTDPSNLTKPAVFDKYVLDFLNRN